MRIKVVSRYPDSELSRYVDVGEEITVTAERGAKLIRHNVGIEIDEEQKPAKKAKPTADHVLGEGD
jgi:hypothetical protein